jgi:deoxyribodipyrimidine photo-lyase
VPAGRRVAIVWFSADCLRLHDNEALAQANAGNTSVLPVFVFEREAGGAADAGLRSRFVRQSVSVLRESLRERGSDLFLRAGEPAALLAELARHTGAAVCFAQEASTAAGRAAQRRVRAALEGVACSLKTHWSAATLHEPSELPFHIRDLPTDFGSFRRALSTSRPPRAEAAVCDLRRPPLGAPDRGEMPAEAAAKGSEGRDALPNALLGGEPEALRQLARVCERLRAGKVVGAAPLTPWLAGGCLSPRRVNDELRAARPQQEAGKADQPWMSYEARTLAAVSPAERL